MRCFFCFAIVTSKGVASVANSKTQIKFKETKGASRVYLVILGSLKDLRTIQRWNLKSKRNRLTEEPKFGEIEMPRHVKLSTSLKFPRTSKIREKLSMTAAQ